MKVKIRNVSATAVEDFVGRKRLVALGTDAMGRVWVNNDVLGGAEWEPVTDAVATEHDAEKTV